MKNLLICLFICSSFSAFADAPGGPDGNGTNVTTSTVCGTTGANDNGQLTALMCHVTPAEGSGQVDQVDFQCMNMASQCAVRASNGWCLIDGNPSDVHWPVVNGECKAPGITTTNNDPDCPTGTNENCTACTTNTASHILDIEMGGYEDGLYVCAVEIVGHDCKLDDAKANADFIEVGNINYGKKWEIAADDIPELGVVDNGHSASAKLHLNSFRYGTKYKVTYCYDFKRVVTSWSSLGEEYQPEINQQGALTGLVKFTLGDGNYFDVAGLSAELSYSCADDEGDITGDDFNDWSTLVAGATHTLSITELLFDLGRNLEGSCRFTAKFVEGNVGDIRPLTDLDKTHVGVINTNASANMELIQN